jgi:hypothetical protein
MGASMMEDPDDTAPGEIGEVSPEGTKATRPKKPLLSRQLRFEQEVPVDSLKEDLTDLKMHRQCGCTAIPSSLMVSLAT